MMDDNLTNKKEKDDAHKKYEQDTNHLVNTKVIELMGDFEKLRVEEIKTKKARDDKMNRIKEIEKQSFKTNTRAKT